MSARAVRRALLVVAVGAIIAEARGAPEAPRPYLGYLCAAGGRQGTVVRVTAGGQNLRGVRRVIVSGEGVRASVVRFEGQEGRLKPEQMQELGRRLRAAMMQKLTGVAGAGRDRPRPRRDAPPARKPAGAEAPRSGDGNPGKGGSDAGKPGTGGTGKSGDGSAPKPGAGGSKRPAAAPEAPVELPDLPMLEDLEGLSLRELRKVAETYLDPVARQNLSGQIAETVEIEVTIDAGAEPGDREIRLETPLGLSNPRLFEVGTLPEVSEEEPNDFETSSQATVVLPAVLNGQIGFRDVDRFRFHARRGQRLVIQAEARRLIPYLADAVPGWFQATVAVLDAMDREVAYADDYRFDPDPVLLLEVPRDGEYVLEIRDAVFRGREDFVYRITVAERPFVTSLFPLGGREGTATTASVGGWNLPWDGVLLDTRPGAPRVREAAWSHDGMRTNPVTYAVDDLPAIAETEPNDRLESAPRLALPVVVDGRIGTAGDVDVYRIEGKAGDEVVAEVEARRLGSPLDSLLSLADAAGNVLAWNDDTEDPTAGRVTHQADSYLRAKLPADGTYVVRVTDAEQHGGDAYAYRLRVGSPRPDFTLLVTPSSVNVPAASHVPVTVHVVRRDGFDGAIDLSLEGAPAGYFLGGGRIPAGRDRIRVTLAAPPDAPADPLPLRIVGRARIGDRTVAHPALPADDMMQAFGPRHLVQAKEILVAVTRSWRRTPPMRLEGDGPVRLPAGGSATVRIFASSLPTLEGVTFQLSDPPPGVTLASVRAEKGVVVVELSADATAAKVGDADNLIVEAYAAVAARGAGGKAAGPKRIVYAGVLPAIPVVVVGR